MNASIYDFKLPALQGGEIDLAEYTGKVVLIVNTASECGFTGQYKGLEALYQQYKDKGLIVLGCPCNQFGGQEPGNETQIAKFCESKFGVTFPLSAKIDVNGEHTHPLFGFLKSHASGILGSEAIKWNFTKFLVNHQGQVVARYAPITTPDKLMDDVEKLLTK